MAWHGPQPDPTPGEIAAACARINSGWSAAERRRRRYGLAEGSRHAKGNPPRFGWTAPLVRVDAELAVMLGER